MYYVFFWVFPRRLRFKSRRFGTLYRFHLPRQLKELQLPRKMEQIEGSETSAFKPQTPGKYPKENILHKEHGESLKSRQIDTCIGHRAVCRFGFRNTNFVGDVARILNIYIYIYIYSECGESYPVLCNVSVEAEETVVRRPYYTVGGVFAVGRR